MRLVDNFLLVYIEFKVELPSANRIWYVSFFIGDGQPDLNQLSFLNICPNEEVLSLLLGSRPLNVISVNIDTRELGVLNEGILTMAITLNFSVIFINLVIYSSKLCAQTSQILVSGRVSSSRI